MTEGTENVVPLQARRGLRLVETGPAPVRDRADETLMLDHAAGDEAAFGELVRRHQKGVLNYMYRMVQNRQIAEELTQEVFVALVRNAARYQPTAKFTTYLYTIASNMVCKEWTRQRRRPRLFSLSAWWGGDGEDGFDPLERMADERADVRADFERGEVSAAVNDALRHLPDQQREAFVLLRFQNLSYQEIAEVCDVPVGTVKSRVVRAERALRPHLERFREYIGS